MVVGAEAVGEGAAACLLGLLCVGEGWRLEPRDQGSPAGSLDTHLYLGVAGFGYLS